MALFLGDELPRDQFFERENKHLRSVISLIERFCAHLTPNEIEESLWRTLLCDHNFQGTLTSKDWPAFQATLEWLRTADNLDYARSLAAWPFLHPLSEVGADRVLFVSRGHRLGIASTESKRGDQIHFFLGSQFPLVLRETGVKFEVVGDCYPHGMMQGEAHDDFSKFTEIEMI